jgi:hypothetical protein
MKIENQAVMFALLCKYTVLAHGDKGIEYIQEGMIRYGRERGERMAANARAHGDPIELWTNQAYGEWQPDFDGQMEFGYLRTEPTLRTYVSKCAWCEAWKKYGLLGYGREYCVNVDKAVYEGFCRDFECTPNYPTMSWGGPRCEFDWGRPLSEEDLEKMKERKAEIGTSCMKDFDYHTAHIYYSLTAVIEKRCPKDAEEIIEKASEEYISIFGQADYDRIFDFSPADF